MAITDYAEAPRRSCRAKKAPASYAPASLTPVKNNKRKAGEISSSSPSVISSASQTIHPLSPSPDSSTGVDIAGVAVASVVPTTTSAAVSATAPITATAVAATSITTVANTPTYATRHGTGNRKASASASSSLSSTLSSPQVSQGEEDNGNKNKNSDPEEQGSSDNASAHVAKKAKTLDELSQEADDAVRDPTTGESCPIAAANYTINRLNRAGERWDKLEAREAAMNRSLRSSAALFETDAMHRKLFNADADMAVKEAKRRFNRARYARRKDYSQRAVNAARRDLEAAKQLKANGPGWVPPAPEPEP